MYIFKKNKRIFFLEVLAILIIVTFLLPIFKVGSTTSIKPDWVFVKITFFIVFFLFNEIRKVDLYRKLLITFSFILISSLISNYISGSYYMQGANYRLPIDILMILDRISTFTFFSYLIYREWISWKTLKHIMIIVFLTALLFGLFQFFNLFGAREIAQRYYLDNDGVQEYNFIQFNRILGVSPAIITWGGISVLLFHFFYFVVKNPIVRYLGVALAVVNVLTAASRAAIAALVVSYILVLLIKLVVFDRSLKSFFRIFISITILFTLFFVLLQEYAPEQIDFLLTRFEKSEDALSTEGRGLQVKYFSSIFSSDFFVSIFGVGPSVIKEYGYLEVDYAYVFFGYGIIGF